MKLKTANDQLTELKAMVDDFLKASHARFNKKVNEKWQTAANASQEKLSALNKDETFDYAYLLYGYAAHIQDELNMQKIALDWCNDKLDKMVAKNYHQFDSYMKYETKRNMIVINDEYARVVDHYREVALSRVQSLEYKARDLRRKADILLEKGKRL